VAFLDLPQLRESVPAHQPLAAVYAVPWPGRVAVWRSPGEDGFELITTLGWPAQMGTLVTDLYPGPTSRFDLGNAAIVDLAFGTLASVTDLALARISHLCDAEGECSDDRGGFWRRRGE
jgi:hypothetical protein